MMYRTLVINEKNLAWQFMDGRFPPKVYWAETYRVHTASLRCNMYLVFQQAVRYRDSHRTAVIWALETLTKIRDDTEAKPESLK